MFNSTQDIQKNDNDTVVTKDNIHLYYEFMSDEDLLKHSLILVTGDTEIKSRFKKVVEILNINKNASGAYDYCNIYGFINGEPMFKKLNIDYGAFVLKYDIFGIKDTLKPIEEYIADIKQSNGYKEYMSKVS